MKVGILGTGDVGRTLANAFLALGHDVMMGSRTKDNEKAQAWLATAGPKASAGVFEEAAKFGDMVVICTLGIANEAALTQAGRDNFKGKIVIDTTNPLDFSNGFPPSLALSGNDSGGEQVQRLLPGAKVVKAFNTVGNPLMFKPELPGGPPDMFICGNDDEAKAQVTTLLKDFGWNTADIGGIESARYLEAMCLVWVLHGAKTNTWNHAFKFLTK